MFLHMGFMLIAYFTSLNLAKSKKNWVKSFCFILAVAVTSTALFALYVMIKMRLQGIDEVESAAQMTINLMLQPALSFFTGAIAGTLLEKILKKNYFISLGAGIIAAFLIGFFGKDIVAAIFAFAIIMVTCLLINSYKRFLSVESA